MLNGIYETMKHKYSFTVAENVPDVSIKECIIKSFTKITVQTSI